jgi:exodeoxyribonuclease VII large subunit
VYTVSAFNAGVASWIDRLPELWVEGEVTELRRQEAWQSVFLTLKDIDDGSTLAVTIARSTFDRLGVEVVDGTRVHVLGRPELYAARGTFQLRARLLEPLGLGAVLAGLERLRQKLAAEGLFDPERKRPLPFLPRRIGVVTGTDAAAKRDVIAAVTARFPDARILVVETVVQGPRAALAITGALQTIAAQPGVDVVVLARGGGSFDDLLPFSDERVVRAVAGSPVPVVSAVGHEHDTPLCDLAADARASTPTAAARLVVPDRAELDRMLDELRSRLRRGARRLVARARERHAALAGRLARAPGLLLAERRAGFEPLAARLRSSLTRLVERRRAEVAALGGRLHALSPAATLDRGYAIVTSRGRVVRAALAVSPGEPLHVRLARGHLEARVESVASETPGPGDAQVP